MLHLVIWLITMLAGGSRAQCPPHPEYIVNGTQSLDPPTSGDRIIPFPDIGNSHPGCLTDSDEPVFSGYFDWKPSTTLDCELGPTSTPVAASIIFGLTNHMDVNL